MTLSQYENKENDFEKSNDISIGMNAIESIKITKHPSLMKKAEIVDDDQMIQLDDEYPKMETLKSILQHQKLTQTQKVIIILGTAIGIQYLHVNDLHHGELCLSNIFIDENFYPHIYLPNSDHHTLSFAEKHKNEIVDITSLCFVAYELLIDQIVFEDNKIDENLLKFDLNKIDNEWQQSFLLTFWPKLDKNLNINDIINDIIDNKMKFGNIDDDKIMCYINKIKSHQISFLKKLENEVKNNDSRKLLLYGRMSLICGFSDEDTKKAVKYLKKASKLGNVDAMYEYGMILKKRNSNESTKKALKYLEKASKKGHIGAGYEYGSLFIFENIIEKIPQGLEIIKNSADNGYMMAQLTYGMFISKFKKLEFSDVFSYYKNPADFGYALAMNNLGLFLYENDFNENENDPNENENDSNENENDSNENENYSNENENDSNENENDSNENENDFDENDFNEKGNDPNENENDSDESENANDSDENENDSNENENDFNENENERIKTAIKYLKMAISLRFLSSFYNYGTFLISRSKNRKKHEEGIKYIKYAADEGLVEAMKKYYLMMIEDYDSLNFTKYLKMAADKEDPDSMKLYGLVLSQGIFVDKDISEASKYYHIAFLNDNDNIESKFIYGKMILEENNDENGWYYIDECIKKNYLPAIEYKSEQQAKINNKKTDDIIQECKKMADDGDVNAMYNYAVMLYNGEGIEENKEEAAKYYKMAIEKCHVGAMNNYASMLFHGDGIQPNILEAIKYYKMAADNGHDISTSIVGLLAYSMEDNKAEGIKYIKKAIEYGFIGPKEFYDELIKNGEIEEENKTKITLKLRKEIYEGNVDSMFSFAVMLLNGDGIYKSRKDAAKYFKMAAEKGHIAAMKDYGLMLLNGDGIPTDKIMAAEWLKKSADKGNCLSMYHYALMLSKGDGIPKNKKEAAKYYKMSADQGYPISMNNYGLMLHDGDGIEINKEVGLKYLKKAAEYGSSMAKLNYGVINNGLSSDINKKETSEKNMKESSDNNKNKPSDENNESINYIKMSADEGIIYAILLYGNYLYTGHNIPMDKKEAARYFKMGADMGSIESMHKYAEMLEKGDGIPLDINEALKYYQKALLKNDSKASKKMKEISFYFSCCL